MFTQNQFSVVAALLGLGAGEDGVRFHRGLAVQISRRVARVRVYVCRGPHAPPPPNQKQW